MTKQSEIYARYYDWEFDLICTRQKQDVKLWQKLAANFSDPILEICCGSGRITQKLAEAGFDITALDNSAEMLNLLKAKKLADVKPVLADMREFSLERKFNFAFIGYSSFQQILKQEDQISCLETIKLHLTKEGVLALDINPRICEGEDFAEKEIAYIADFPAPDSRLTMFTSHKIDRISQIKHWEDTYVEIYPDGRRTEFVNHISLKECSPDYMKLLFEKCGFQIVDVFGDFEGGEVNEESENIIWMVRAEVGSLSSCEL